MRKGGAVRSGWGKTHNPPTNYLPQGRVVIENQQSKQLKRRPSDKTTGEGRGCHLWRDKGGTLEGKSHNESKATQSEKKMGRGHEEG